MTAAIALEDIVVRYDRVDVLRGVSLQIATGEIVALVGPSGSGKSTALRVILGFIAPREGIVRLDSQMASEPGRIIVAPEDRGLAVVFQDLALWPHMTVEDNLGFGLESRRAPRAERRERIHNMLDRVGLADKAARHPGQLSGGERQRVAIARALVLQPRAVLFDEPLTNLDVLLRRDLFSLLRSLLKETGAAALYVTHEIREALALGARIAVLEQGRIVADGLAHELADAPPTPFVQALLSDENLHVVRPVDTGVTTLTGTEEPR